MRSEVNTKKCRFSGARRSFFNANAKIPRIFLDLLENQNLPFFFYTSQDDGRTQKKNGWFAHLTPFDSESNIFLLWSSVQVDCFRKPKIVLSLWDDFLRFPIWFMRKCVVYAVFAWSFNTIYTVLYVVQHVPCRLPYLLIVYVMLLLLVFLFVVVCRSNCDEWLVTLRCYCGAFFINVIWLDRFDISGNAQCSMYCIEPSAVDMGRMVERSMSKK